MKSLNVQIENPVNDLDEMPNLMKIIETANLSRGFGDNLFNDLIVTLDILLPTNTILKYGKGANHVWVSYRNKRILLITKS